MNKEMKKITMITAFLLILIHSINAQNAAEMLKMENNKVVVHYYNNPPFAFADEESETPKGIEIDLIKAFSDWLKTEKGIEVNLSFVMHKRFDEFYTTIASSQNINTIGLGSVSITEPRKSEVKFSAPYLKNVSVLISSGEIETARSEEELIAQFEGLIPVHVKGTVHGTYIDSLRKRVGNYITPVYVSSVNEVPQKIKESGKYFGYIDNISFWNYIKTHDEYLKMHRYANVSGEYFGFIFPKESYLNLLTNEFLESGFGFTATKKYHEILSNYLGHEVIEKVEIDY